jgi:hypothetical protein
VRRPFGQAQTVSNQDLSVGERPLDAADDFSGFRIGPRRARLAPPHLSRKLPVNLRRLLGGLKPLHSQDVDASFWLAPVASDNGSHIARMANQENAPWTAAVPGGAESCVQN